MNASEHALQGLIESILLLSSEPVPMPYLARITGTSIDDIKITLNQMIDTYLERDGGIVILEIAGGYQFATNRKYADILRPLFDQKKSERLTKSAMEVLAIIAYKQPIHVAAIDEIRGASSRGHIAILLQRGFIVPLHRLELPGRPMAYGTTQEFLKYFHLNSLTDMPKLNEIKEFQLESLSGE